MKKEMIVENCRKLLKAYKSGEIGECKMPEEAHPSFENQELRFTYFTLPMALNYQRDSYNLWQAALSSYNDFQTNDVFDVAQVSNMTKEELFNKLIKYKLALQPNKHLQTWQTICKSVLNHFGSFSNLFKQADYDFLKLKEIIQIKYKKEFPYLSGPKIFNYWSFIIQEYGKIKLKNSEFIEIAPDTHITQCSVKLGVISQEEADSLSKEKLNNLWREILKDSGIHPIEMHPPLWFWSRKGFEYKL